MNSLNKIEYKFFILYKLCYLKVFKIRGGNVKNENLMIFMSLNELSGADGLSFHTQVKKNRRVNKISKPVKILKAEKVWDL